MDKFLNKSGLHFLIQDHKKYTKKNTTHTLNNIKAMLESQFSNTRSIHTSGSSDTDDVDGENTANLKINLGQYRSSDSFNTQTKKILNMITSGEDITPVGSSKYKIHRYPGDIDMYEEIKSCCSLKDASKDIKQKLQVVVRQIVKEPSIYLADFKAGIDDRYTIYIGELDAYNKINNYKAVTIKKKIILLKKQQLFSNKEFMNAMKLVKSNPTIEEWHTLEDFIHTFYIIRWEADEIIDGYKNIRDTVDKKGNELGTIKINLNDAIQAKSVCKLDIWALINGRYIEITNFLVFIYIDNKGHEHIININIDNYILNMIKDLKKYGKGGYKYNSLKYAKRLWSLANTLDETKKLQLLFPLFSSGAAILYQINAEIEVLIEMLEEIEDKPLTKKQLKEALKNQTKGVKFITMEAAKVIQSPVPLIIDQIENFKSRVGLVYEQFDDSEQLFNIVNNIVHFYRSKKKNYLNQKEKQIIINHLKEIESIIQHYVDAYASKYLAQYHLDDVHQYDSIIPFL